MADKRPTRFAEPTTTRVEGLDVPFVEPTTTRVEGLDVPLGDPTSKGELVPYEPPAEGGKAKPSTSTKVGGLWSLLRKGAKLPGGWGLVGQFLEQAATAAPTEEEFEKILIKNKNEPVLGEGISSLLEALFDPEKTVGRRDVLGGIKKVGQVAITPKLPLGLGGGEEEEVDIEEGETDIVDEPELSSADQLLAMLRDATGDLPRTDHILKRIAKALGIQTPSFSKNRRTGTQTGLFDDKDLGGRARNEKILDDWQALRKERRQPRNYSQDTINIIQNKLDKLKLKERMLHKKNYSPKHLDLAKKILRKRRNKYLKDLNDIKISTKGHRAQEIATFLDKDRPPNFFTRRDGSKVQTSGDFEGTLKPTIMGHPTQVPYEDQVLYNLSGVNFGDKDEEFARMRQLKEKKKEFLKKYPQGQEIIEDKIKRITTPGQGEPHKFTKYQAGGPVGIRNALMMTPVGQQAIQQYAFGGQTTTGGGFTDKTYEERLKGERFLNPLGYKLTDIADTLEDKPPEDPYPYPYLYPKKNISTDDRNGEGQSQGYAQWGADYKDPFVDRRTGLTKEEFEMAGGGWTDPTETIGGLGGLGSTLANIGSAAINFLPGIGWLPKAGATLSNAFLNPDSLAQKGLRSLGIIDEEPTEISAPVIAAIPEAEAQPAPAPIITEEQWAGPAPTMKVPITAPVSADTKPVVKKLLAETQAPEFDFDTNWHKDFAKKTYGELQDVLPWRFRSEIGSQFDVQPQTWNKLDVETRQGILSAIKSGYDYLSTPMATSGPTLHSSKPIEYGGLTSLPRSGVDYSGSAAGPTMFGDVSGVTSRGIEALEGPEAAAVYGGGSDDYGAGGYGGDGMDFGGLGDYGGDEMGEGVF